MCVLIIKPGTYKHTDFEMGKAEVISEGTDVTLLTYGFLFGNALETKQLLEKEGLSVGLVNMRSLKPVDEACILRCANRSRLVVTIEDHFQSGGLYSIVAETLLNQAYSATIFPIALKERWFKPGLLSEVLAYEGFTPEAMAVHYFKATATCSRKNN